MAIPKINSAHGSSTRNIINRAIDSLNVQGKSIQDLVAKGQLTPSQYTKLLITINDLAKGSSLEVERERINNLIAHAGETEGNSELLDIRVGADGVIYGTAGEAVRYPLRSFSDQTDAELNGIFDVAKDLGYEREVNEGTVIQSGTYSSDKEIVSTFYAWASPLYYNNETFDVASVYLITESPNVTIRLFVMDTDFNVLAYTDTIKSNAGSAWVDFRFSTSIDSGVIKEDVFYIGVETESTSERLSTAIISNSEQNAASVEYGTYYKSGITGNWRGSSSQPGTSLLLKLKNGSYNVTYKKDDVDISDEDKIILPPKINAVVGKEINIYFDNIMSGYHEDYYIDINGPVGMQQNERWTAIPDSAGSYNLTVALYSKDYRKLSEDTTTIVVTNDTTPTSGQSALFVGSSTTASGAYTRELLNIYTSAGSHLNLIGTKGTGDNLTEGIGGWTFKKFHEDTESPFVFNGVFNFGQYLSSNGFATPDYVLFHSGINDVFSAKNDGEVSSRNAEAITHMEAMISKIHADFPNIKIGIILSYPASDQDAFGNNYGTSQTAWRYKRNAFLALKEMISQLENRENKNVYIVPVHANIDTRNNMPTHEVQVNSRNTQKIIRQSNGIHMSSSGSSQFADSVYYWLKSPES